MDGDDGMATTADDGGLAGVLVERAPGEPELAPHAARTRLSPTRAGHGFRPGR